MTQRGEPADAGARRGRTPDAACRHLVVVQVSFDGALWPPPLLAVTT